MALGTPIAGMPTNLAGSGYVSTANRRPANTTVPYASSGQTGYGNTPEYLATVARINAGNTARQGANAYQQQQNAYNYFSNVAGYDPATGMTADTAAYLGRLGVDANGNPTGGGQLGMTVGNRDYMGKLLNQDYASSLARLGLDEQGNQLEKAGAIRRTGAGGYYDQLGGLIDRNLLNQLAGYDVQEGTARNKATTARRGEISDSTARGALQTYGTREDLGDIAKSLWQDVLGLNVQREGARIGTEKEKVSLGEQRAQDKDRIAQLDLKAKDYGLQRDQFKTELDRGLAKLGIDAYFTSEDIMDKANSAKASDRAVAEQIIRNSMDYSSQFPSTSPLSRPRATATQTTYGGRGTPLR